MATEKEVKRGYVKWIDDDGVFHKEPLADHPELLAKASPDQQLRAEEARRLNNAAESEAKDSEKQAETDAKDTLDALKKAPDDVLTSAQLVGDSEPASAAEEPVKKDTAGALPSNEPIDSQHDAALQELRENTAA